MDPGFLVGGLIEWFAFSLATRGKRRIMVPITIVNHKSDGSWDFYSRSYKNKIRISTLHDAIENDVTVKEVSDLPVGFSAQRESADSQWKRSKTFEVHVHL